MKKHLLQDADLAAPIFAALGEPSRMTLMLQLIRDGQQSISQLSAGMKTTRQAVSRHLFVLENVGLVSRTLRQHARTLEPDSRAALEADHSTPRRGVKPTFTARS
jgi:DNA-binding transcriptional ArsR family regulator